MLLTIISSLLGIVSSTIPNLLRYWERKQEINYELQITTLKIEAAIKGVELEKQLEEARSVSADFKSLVEEGESLRQHDSSLNTGSFIDDLRASVRPVITYSMFMLFFGVKILLIFVVLRQSGFVLNMDTVKLLSDTILDESTIAIFGTILGFWFGSRALTKMDDTVYQRYTATLESKKPPVKVATPTKK